jgi:cytochrome c-type biogenesis protein CcmH
MGFLSRFEGPRRAWFIAGALAASAGVVALMAFFTLSRMEPPRLAGMPSGHPATAMPGPAPTGAGDLDTLTQRLSAKLAGEGSGDGAGWLLLARSYVELHRHAEAVPAFARARAILGDGDAQMLADYADAVATAAGRRFDAGSRAIIAAALKADPANAKALELDASAAYESGDYARAATQWRKVQAAIDPNSDHGRIIAANIAESLSRSAPSAGSTAGKPRGS